MSRRDFDALERDALGRAVADGRREYDRKQRARERAERADQAGKRHALPGTPLRTPHRDLADCTIAELERAGFVIRRAGDGS